MKLDLNDDYVYATQVTVDQVRGWLDGENDIPADVNTAFDNAQGAVFKDEHNRAFVVIEITK
jgi:hypothetical protein